MCGRWLVEGNPQVILFDVGSAAYKMNDFKQELYDSAGIGAPQGDQEVNDVTIFGFMVAQFLADFRVFAQFPSSVYTFTFSFPRFVPSPILTSPLGSQHISTNGCLALV